MMRSGAPQAIHSAAETSSPCTVRLSFSAPYQNVDNLSTFIFHDKCMQRSSNERLETVVQRKADLNKTSPCFYSWHFLHFLMLPLLVALLIWHASVGIPEPRCFSEPPQVLWTCKASWKTWRQAGEGIYSHNLSGMPINSITEVLVAGRRIQAIRHIWIIAFRQTTVKRQFFVGGGQISNIMDKFPHSTRVIWCTWCRNGHR